MLTNCKSVKANGVDIIPVQIETSVEPGIGIHLIGLADSQVKESLLRTVTALQASGYKIPGKKIVINITPAEIIKKGSGYDLPIALNIIAASEQQSLPGLERTAVIGELGLDGSVRSVAGALEAVLLAKNTYNIDSVIVPATDAGYISKLDIDLDGKKLYGVTKIEEAINVFNGNHPETVINPKPVKAQKPKDKHIRPEPFYPTLQRALEISAAGGHDILLIKGNNSVPSVTIAKTLQELLPPMNKKEQIETASIYSQSDKLGLFAENLSRPVRAPHHSASIAAMAGGGSDVHPGEVSLAHNGILCIDEAEMLPKSVSEILAHMLEDKEVKLARLKGITTYPADFLLMASIKPCPCGNYGLPEEKCTCSTIQRLEYLNKLYGPLYDRMDIQVYVQDPRSHTSMDDIDTSKNNVANAREIQMKRNGGKLNSELRYEELMDACRPDKECIDMIEKIITNMGLSARAYSRMLRIARTIADLSGLDKIGTTQIAEAASFRFLDRKLTE